MNMEHEYSTGMNSVHGNSDPSAPRSGATEREKKAAPGRYLKQPPVSPRRRKRRRRKLNPRFVIMLAVLLAMLIVIICGIRSCTKPSIIGTWDLDGTTVYEFYKGGKGALVLLTASYDFTYQIKDDVIYIDFIDQQALDAKYSYEVKGDLLFVTGGPGDSRTEYVMQRVK